MFLLSSNLIPALEAAQPGVAAITAEMLKQGMGKRIHLIKSRSGWLTAVLKSTTVSGVDPKAITGFCF